MKTEFATKTWRRMNKRFAGLCIALVLILFGAQFMTLAMLGTRGTEVSRVRIQQQQLRLENEHLRAKIDSARTLENIEAGVQMFELQNAHVKPVDVTQETLQNLRSVSLAE